MSSGPLVDGLPGVLTVLAAVGSGVVAGVFFAFSTFVMAGLRRLAPSQGMAAMQSVNKTAVTPAFMSLLFGTAIVSIAVAVFAVGDLGASSSRFGLIGAVAYLILVIGTTVAFHVPRNDRLAALEADAPGSEPAWRSYAREWTRGNHVRTVGSTIATVMFILTVRSR